MKKIALIISALVCTFFSCTKDNGTTSQIITYSLQGLTNLTIGNTNAASLVLNFHATGNLHEKVTLSFTGLPSGITVDSNHISSGTPDFGSFVTFTNDGTATAGSYNATLHCVGTVSGDRTFSFKISVAPSIKNSICVNQLLGIYSNCTVTSYHYNFNYSEIILADPLGKKDRVILDGFINNNILYADIICQNDSIIIPLQNGNNNYTFSGNGIISGNTINIYWRGGFANDSGVTIMNR